MEFRKKCESKLYDDNSTKVRREGEMATTLVKFLYM